MDLLTGSSEVRRGRPWHGLHLASLEPVIGLDIRTGVRHGSSWHGVWLASTKSVVSPSIRD